MTNLYRFKGISTVPSSQQSTPVYFHSLSGTKSPILHILNANFILERGVSSFGRSQYSIGLLLTTFSSYLCPSLIHGLYISSNCSKVSPLSGGLVIISRWEMARMVGPLPLVYREWGLCLWAIVRCSWSDLIICLVILDEWEWFGYNGSLSSLL